MAVSFTNNGDGTITVNHAYTRQQEVIINFYGTIAEAHYSGQVDGVPTPYSELTNNQKLEVVDDRIVQLLKNDERRIKIRAARAGIVVEDTPLGDN